MAVFTPITASQLSPWLKPLGVGALVRFEGITAGIENTNYFVDTETGRFVLTLFERLAPDALRFDLGLMRHLASRGIPCPNPVRQPDGSDFSMLADRPAALVSRLRGQDITHPDAAHCAQVGQLLARMHLAAHDYTAQLENPRGLRWFAQTIEALSACVTPAQRTLMQDESAAQHLHAHSSGHAALPRSAVHADLFRDNLLFDRDQLSGVIDFYFAGVDTWIFDLAVVCNDWCIDQTSGACDQARIASLTDAYQAVRALTPAEHDAWPWALRRAALRFWLSRLADHHLPRSAHMLAPKDPAHFERILVSRGHTVPALARHFSHGAHACTSDRSRP